MARVIFDNGCVIVGMVSFVWLVYLGMKSDPSMKPTVHPPDRKLETMLRKSAARGRWV